MLRDKRQAAFAMTVNTTQKGSIASGVNQATTMTRQKISTIQECVCLAAATLTAVWMLASATVSVKKIRVLAKLNFKKCKKISFLNFSIVCLKECESEHHFTLGRHLAE